MLFFFSSHGQQPYLCIAICGGTETFRAFVLDNYKSAYKINGGLQTSVKQTAIGYGLVGI